MDYPDDLLLDLNLQDFKIEGCENSTSANCTFDVVEMMKNQEMPTDELINKPAAKAVVITLYCIVIVLGTFLNALVVATVIKTKQMWNATNIFIANLAIADIFVCLFDLPLSLYQAMTRNWVFGMTLCRVISMTFGVVVYTSTMSLAMIAVDRFILIVYPLKKRMTVQMALMIVVVIALLSMAVASPIAIFSTQEVYSFPIRRILCREKWPTLQHRKVYTIVTLVVQFFLPLVVILVLYIMIFRTLKTRMQKRTSRKTKTTRMLVAVVLVFFLTWTPFHLYAIIMDFKTRLVPGEYIRLIDALLKIFALSSSCINPMLYGWMNDNYRNAFLSFIRKPRATPHNIQREDSDEVTRTKAAAAQSAPMKHLLHKINPDTATIKPEAKNTDEIVPLQEGPPAEKAEEKKQNGEEKCVVVTMENGHCNASVQTPLLPDNA